MIFTSMITTATSRFHRVVSLRWVPLINVRFASVFSAFILFADASLPNGQRKEVREQAGSQTESALSAAPTSKVPFGQRVRMQEGAQAQQMWLQRASGAKVQKGAYLIDQSLR